MKAIDKYFTAILIAVTVLSLSSCYSEIHQHGPHGRDGEAFFAVGYEIAHPYSYWDNNNSVPVNPTIGQYHHTFPGIYDFEYFVNPTDYWYGTYEIWINSGGPGRPYDQPGYDGLDTYLMLICDPNGYAEVRNELRTSSNIEERGDSVVITGQDENTNFRITMKKTTVSERQAQNPKYINEKEDI